MFRARIWVVIGLKGWLQPYGIYEGLSSMQISDLHLSPSCGLRERGSECDMYLLNNASSDIMADPYDRTVMFGLEVVSFMRTMILNKSHNLPLGRLP